MIFQRGTLNRPGGALAAHPQCPAATVVVQVGMLRAEALEIETSW